VEVDGDGDAIAEAKEAVYQTRKDLIDEFGGRKAQKKMRVAEEQRVTASGAAVREGMRKEMQESAADKGPVHGTLRVCMLWRGVCDVVARVYVV